MSPRESEETLILLSDIHMVVSIFEVKGGQETTTGQDGRHRFHRWEGELGGLDKLVKPGQVKDETQLVSIVRHRKWTYDPRSQNDLSHSPAGDQLGHRV
jgi:hypothetical protein